MESKPPPRDQRGAWGAIWGAVLLGCAQALMTWIKWTWVIGPILGGGRMPKSQLEFPVSIGLIWGVVLGRAAGNAHAAWSEGNYLKARHICRKVGFWALFLNIPLSPFNLYFEDAMRAVRLYFQSGTKIIPTGEPVYYVLLVLFSLPLQAAALMLLLGFLLPKRENQIVQVTEKLRL